MDISKIDLRKNDDLAGSHDRARAELGEEELSRVSGGKSSSLALACVSGKHLAVGKLHV